MPKTKNTPPQAELNRSQRIQNVENVFMVQNEEKISGKRIFLVDDVYTTGATMEEAAQALKASGAKQIFGIVVARG